LTLAENTPRFRPRITLIDTLRGAALVAMASYHFTWDLEFFGYVGPGTATSGWWKLYARSIASSFLFLAGVSLVLAHYPTIRWNSFWKRFGMVAGAAAAISIATFFATPNEWIFFGILHCIALGSLIGLAFLRAPPLLTAGVAGLIVLALIIDSQMPGTVRSSLFDPRFLAWTGLSATPPRSNEQGADAAQSSVPGGSPQPSGLPRPPTGADRDRLSVLDHQSACASRSRPGLSSKLRAWMCVRRK